MANVELKWAKEVKHFCKNVPMILVANKIDIRTDQEILKELETDHIVSIFACNINILSCQLLVPKHELYLFYFASLTTDTQ